MHIHPGHMDANLPLSAADAALAARRAENTRKKLLAAAAGLEATSGAESAWMVGAWAGQSGQSGLAGQAGQSEHPSHSGGSRHDGPSPDGVQAVAPMLAVHDAYPRMSAEIGEAGLGQIASRNPYPVPLDAPSGRTANASTDSVGLSLPPPVSYWA